MIVSACFFRIVFFVYARICKATQLMETFLKHDPWLESIILNNTATFDNANCKFKVPTNAGFGTGTSCRGIVVAS